MTNELYAQKNIADRVRAQRLRVLLREKRGLDSPPANIKASDFLRCSWRLLPQVEEAESRIEVLNEAVSRTRTIKQLVGLRSEAKNTCCLGSGTSIAGLEPI
jgi:hypothetical protein